MAKSPTCPDRSLLVRLARSGFAGNEAETIEKHVLGCDRCAMLLDAILGKDPLLQQLPALRDSDPRNDKAAEALVRRLLKVKIEPAPSRSPNSPDDVPEFPGYIIVEVLGRGGQSVVYKAHQPRLDRFVALKTISLTRAGDPEDRSRFEREAKAVAQLKHPNVVQIHDIGEHRGDSYLSLEFVDGTNLAKRIAGVPQRASASARMVETLARAMHVAHGHGIVHRDLKPGNILLTVDGVPKIADFGLAKRLQADSDLTHTGNILGTPSYMSPEQAAGRNRDVGPASDIYALGAILYELLTGRAPFLGATSWEVISQVLGDEPVPPRRLQPSVPRDLETICLKCLAKDPAKRYADAEDLADDLARQTAGLPIQGRRTGGVERVALWCRRRPALAGTIAAALAAIAVIGTVSLRQVLEERETFRKERDNAQAKLYRAVVSESRLLMQAREAGWRREALDRLKEAASLEVAERDVPALRDLAIQYIGIDAPGFRNQATMPEHPKPVITVTFDSSPRAVFLGNTRSLAIEDRIVDLTKFADFAFSETTIVEKAKDRGAAWGLVASPDGRLLAIGGGDKTLRIWNVADRKLVRTLRGQDDVLWCVAFSPDAKYVAAGSSDNRTGTIEIWEAATGRPHLHLRGHERLVRSIAFHPGGRWLVSCSSDGIVLLWDLTTAKQVGVLHRFEQAVYDVAFSPEGRKLAAACHDRHVALWDFDGEETPKLPQAPTLSPELHPSEAWAVGFSPDGRTLASGSAPGTIVLWDAKTFGRLATLRAGGGETRCISFSRDGELLAGAQYGGPTMVWDLTELRKTLAELKLDW
jgi:eukaryotic-like serine/threonine-protein kinase